MSLILEALKKSEQQRRLGEAPTLGSPVHAVRRRRSLLPLVGALAVIALGVGWWLSRSPVDTTAPPAAPQTAATKPIAPPADARSAAAAQQGKKPAPHFTTPAGPPTAAAPQGPAMARMGDAAQNPQRNDRTAANPNAATAPPPRPLAVPADAKPATAKPTVADTKEPAAVPAAAPNAATAPATAATPNPAAAAAPAPASTTPTTTAATPAPHAAAAPAAAAQPALPSVWELPYATRKDIPELAITMHVYASDPSERFVVIKGDRHVEGDDLGDGLTLKEIRADGMVLDYKGQRFVYPRDGR